VAIAQLSEQVLQRGARYDWEQADLIAIEQPSQERR
jgi:hypothetical protein